METKKVEKVRESIKSYNGKNGPVYVHGVTVEGNPQEWEYHSLSEKCSKFTPGQVATFTTEVKTNGQYTNYKISPANQTNGFTGGGKGGFKPDQKDEGRISALSIYSSTMAGLQGSMDVKEWSKVKERCELAWEWVQSKSDKFTK